MMSTEARSSCFPYINGLRQGESSRTLKALFVVMKEEWKLQTAEKNQMITSSRQSRSISYGVGPYKSGGSRKDGDGDTSFQWSQFTTPCSHLMLLIKDTMVNKRPTTQLPQL
ncbi:hypothetical protein Tco_0367100 [Tanacetum coccineum]